MKLGRKNDCIAKEIFENADKNDTQIAGEYQMVARFVLFFLCLFSYLQAAHLTPSDVHKVMDELFEYHIDKKEMSSLIVERSLKVYLNQFDTRKAYLIQSEFKQYLQPNSAFTQSILNDYQKDEFSHYFSMNAKIQKSILRARKWRSEWEKDPKVLVAEAKAISLTDLTEDPEDFVDNDQALKKRHYEELLKLIRLHLEETGSVDLDGKEAKLVALCEKQLCMAENDYLGINDKGASVGEEKYQHFVLLRLLKALAHSLDDHTAYYSPEEAYAMKVQLEKGMCGIGVVLHEGIDGVVVADILAGGPAAASDGLKKGDCIIEVEGVNVKEVSFHKVLEILKGGEGSKCNLGVIRKEENKGENFLRVSLTRKKIVLDEKRVDVSYEPFGDGVIGKITLYSFYEGDDGISSEKDIRKAIDYLKSKGPLYGLVLDMRENSGGFLSQAVRVSGLFISGGVVVISKYSDGSMKYYRAVEGRRFYDGPLAILISRGSASATEIVAQALQDYGVAVVIGDEQTYGKGTIQHQTVTSDKTNSFFKVTIGKYYTVSGKSTQIDGVKSDILVPTVFSYEKMGEVYSDYPLAADKVAPAFNDTLADLDPYAKKWFSKYYLPSMQKPISVWREKVSTLQENSLKRVADNKNYQLFLKKLKKIEDKKQFGINDLQMEEAVNVVKDMIFLQNQQAA